MSTIGVLVIITIIAGLAITLLAFVLYKRHLDRVVSGEERGLHTKAVEPGTAIRSVLICILCIWLLVSMADISSLKSEIQGMKQQMNSQYNQIASEAQEIKDRLDAQEAVCEEYRYGIHTIDTKSQTAEMELHVSMKEYTENTSVSVVFGNTATELQRNHGADFSGNIPVELFTLYESFPVLIAETEGVSRTQVLDQCPNGYFAEFLLPMLITAEDDSRIKYNGKGNLVFSGNMTVLEDGSKIDGLTLQSASIAFELDGKLVNEIPLHFIAGVADAVDISGTIPAEKNQPFYICLRSVTSTGWTVTQRVISYDWEEGHTVYMGGDLSVTDENGVLLFGVRELD